MNRIIQSLARWGRANSPVGLLVISLLLMATFLAACSPSNEEDLAAGVTAPSFTLPAASGDQVSLSDYLGSKPVLLYFHMADG
jgi:cytochrome oxidase Cu insertion factor (SCO1/SenC/PrrC family)